MLSADVKAEQQPPLDAGKEGAKRPVPVSAVGMEISPPRDGVHLVLPDNGLAPTSR